MLTVVIVLCSVISGLVCRQIMAWRKRPGISNSCIECGEPVPKGYHLCMQCWSHSEIDPEFTADKWVRSRGSALRRVLCGRHQQRAGLSTGTSMLFLYEDSQRCIFTVFQGLFRAKKG